MQTKPAEIKKILDNVFTWSKNQSFQGYNKHDGLNSPILRFCLGWSKWSRIIAIQSVMRSPVNFRPVVCIPKTINSKGVSLYITGLLDQHSFDPDSDHLDEATKLVQLLLQNRSTGNWSGDCWGYPYPWQDHGFYAPLGTPNAVVTCFVCESLLKMYNITGEAQYLDIVGRAIDFFLNDLSILKDNDEMLCLAYMPLPMQMKVMDVSILIGAVVAQYATITNDSSVMATAKRLVEYVVSKQTDYAAWFYTDPPEDSLITHDNYHTGFILDALWRYMEASDDWSWKSNYEKGLEFYAEKLFNTDGSPRWMHDKDFPHDIHGAAQGLISFSLAVKSGYHYEELLEKIASWSIQTMYHHEGRFFYQQCKWGVIQFTLLRWCNGWMYRGLSAFANILNEVNC